MVTGPTAWAPTFHARATAVSITVSYFTFSYYTRACVISLMANEPAEGGWDDGQERSCFPLGLLHMLPRPSYPQSTPHLLLVNPPALALNPDERSVGTLDGPVGTGPVISVTTAGPSIRASSRPPYVVQVLLRWVPAGLRSLKLVGLVGSEVAAPDTAAAARAVFEARLHVEQGIDVSRRQGKPTRIFQVQLPSSVLQGIQQPTSLMLAVTADRPDAAQQAVTFWNNLQSLAGSTRPEASMLAQLGCLTGNLAPVHYAASILLLPPAVADEVNSMWQHAVAQQNQQTAASSAFANVQQGARPSGASVDLAPAGDEASSLATAVWPMAHAWLGEFAAFVADMAALLQVSGREMQGGLAEQSVQSAHSTRKQVSATMLSQQVASMPPQEQERLAAVALRCLPVVDNVMHQLLAYQSKGAPLPQLSTLIQNSSSIVHSSLQLLHTAILTGRRGSSNVFDESLLSSGMLHGSYPPPLDMHLDPWEGGAPLNYFHMVPPSPVRNPCMEWPAAESSHLWQNTAVPPSPFAPLSFTQAPGVKDIASASTTVPSGGAHAIMNLEELEGTASAPLFFLPDQGSGGQASGQKEASKSASNQTESGASATPSVLSLPANTVEPVQFEGRGFGDEVNAAAPVRAYLWEQQSIASGALHASASCNSLHSGGNARRSSNVSTALSGAFSTLNARNSFGHARSSCTHARTSGTYARTSGTHARTSGTYARSSIESGGAYLRGSMDSNYGGLRSGIESCGVRSSFERPSRTSMGEEHGTGFMGPTLVPMVLPTPRPPANLAEQRCVPDLPSTAMTTMVGALLAVPEEQSNESKEDTPNSAVSQLSHRSAPLSFTSPHSSSRAAFVGNAPPVASAAVPPSGALVATPTVSAAQPAARGAWFTPAASTSAERASAGIGQQSKMAAGASAAPASAAVPVPGVLLAAAAAPLAAPAQMQQTVSEKEQPQKVHLGHVLPQLDLAVQVPPLQAQAQPIQAVQVQPQDHGFALARSVVCGFEDERVEQQYLQASSEHLSSHVDPYACGGILLVFLCTYLLLGYGGAYSATHHRLLWLSAGLIALCKSMAACSWLLPPGTASQLSAVRIGLPWFLQRSHVHRAGQLNMTITRRSCVIAVCLIVESIIWLVVAVLGANTAKPGLAAGSTEPASSTLVSSTTAVGGMAVVVLNSLLMALLTQVPFHTLGPILMLASLTPIPTLCHSCPSWPLLSCVVAVLSLGVTAAVDARNRVRYMQQCSKLHVE